MRDVALTTERAAVVVIGSQASQCRSLSTRQGSQFGECGQQGPGGATANALNRRKPLNFCVKLGIGLFQRDDFLLDPFQMFSQGSLKVLAQAANERVMMMFLPQLLLSEEVEQFLPAIDQGFETQLRSRRHEGGRWLEEPAIVGQDEGINTVGFGEQATGPGKITHLAGIDQRERDLILVEGLQEWIFISTGSFTDHLDRTAATAEVAQEALMTLVIMRKSVSGQVCQRAGIEGEFGNIQAQIERRSFHEE
jgi:hypothetical protein